MVEVKKKLQKTFLACRANYSPKTVGAERAITILRVLGQPRQIENYRSFSHYLWVFLT